MARASIPTLLPLDRYAKIMGLNPAHFNGGHGNTRLPFTSGCSHPWFQYDWQSGQLISRESIAEAIADAEREIAEFLGYWPAPVFIEKEMHSYPQHYRPEWMDSGRRIDARYKSIKARWGRVIQAGQRGTTHIGNVTTGGGGLAYSDDDGDSFNELVTVSIATTLTDPNEIKVYFPGNDADPLWEIRPALSKSISGGTFTAKYNVWQFILPAKWEEYPTPDGLAALDLTDTANLLTSAEVHREYPDFAVESAQFFWERSTVPTILSVCNACGGSLCPVCSLAVQDGCLHVRDVNLGLVAPVPSTYDSDAGEWYLNNWTECRAPDIVKLWYYAGDLSQRYLGGLTHDPLSDYWARIIAYLATARLERSFCACKRPAVLAEDLQRDLAFIPPDGGTYRGTFALLDNPFGTRKGEVYAWKRLKHFADKTPRVAVV